MSKLPDGWAIARLDELAVTTSGGTPSRNEPTNFGGNILWFKSGELNDNSLPAWTEEKLTDKGLNNSSARLTPVGSVLIAMYGATVGKLGILQVPAATNQAICAATPKSGLETKYLFYFLQSQRPALLSQRVGGAQPNINQQIIRAVKVPLPPLPEQRRIVAEIEKQFTRIDVSENSIDSAASKLKQLRRAIIEKVCREFTNYQFVPFAELIDSLKNGISEKPAGNSGFPILKISAVRAFQLRLDERRFLADANQYQGFELRENDLLFTRYNGNRELVGVCACVPPLGEILLYPDKLIRVRLKPGSNSKFYELMLNGGVAREHIQSRIRTTAGQSGISGADIKSAPVPLARLSEQTKIVEKFQDSLSLTDYLKCQFSPAMVRSHRLRQAILAKAFSGQLVPQDPSDEPASVLLERIRNHRLNPSPKRSPSAQQLQLNPES